MAPTRSCSGRASLLHGKASPTTGCYQVTTQRDGGLNIMSEIGSARAVFLDRDGTLNVDYGYVYQIEQLDFVPQAALALTDLQNRGFKLIVVTNQSGVARGMYTESEVLRFHDEVSERLGRSGVEITAFYYCPHLPDATESRYAIACECRKPQTGLFIHAAADHGIDLSSSYAIGDRMRDVLPLIELGGRGVLIDPGLNAPVDQPGLEVVGSLYDAAQLIISMAG